MIQAWPFVLQGVVLVVDEFYCHHRRGLGRWERWGHPLDTGAFVLCLLFLSVAAPSALTGKIYAALSVVSCAVITKDEWEHQRRCDGFENWLHALLFVLHPCLLLWAGYLWWTQDPEVAAVLVTSTAAAGSFMLYQIVYWNFWRPAGDQ